VLFYEKAAVTSASKYELNLEGKPCCKNAVLAKGRQKTKEDIGPT
jgi:hypothetical protein